MDTILINVLLVKVQILQNIIGLDYFVITSYFCNISPSFSNQTASHCAPVSTEVSLILCVYD